MLSKKVLKEGFSKYLNRLAPSIVVLTFLCYLAQAVSFFSETFGIYAFMVDMTGSIWFSLLVSVTIALMIELAVLELVIYIADSFAEKDYWKNADQMSKGLVIFAILILSFATYFSMFLSKKNIGIAARGKKITKDINIADIEEKRKQELQGIIDLSSGNYNKFDNIVNQSRDLINDEFDSEIEAQQVEKEKWERKEQRSGLSYTTQKLNIDARIAKLKKERAVKLQSLSSKELSTGENFQGSFKESTLLINQKYDKEVEEAKSANLESKRKQEQDREWYASFLENLAAYSVIIFIVARVFIQFGQAKSGIVRVNYLSPTFFKSGLIPKLITLLNLYLTRDLHNWVIDKISSFDELKEIETFTVLDDVDSSDTSRDTNGDSSLNSKVVSISSDTKKKSKVSNMGDKTKKYTKSIGIDYSLRGTNRGSDSTVVRHKRKKYSPSEIKNLKGNLRKKKSRLRLYKEENKNKMTDQKRQSIERQQNAIADLESQLESINAKVG